jgi:hypothetical protein
VAEPVLQKGSTEPAVRDLVVGPQTWSVIDSLENEGPIVS